MVKQIFTAFAAALMTCTGIYAGNGRTSITVMSYNIRYGTAPDGDNSWENRKPATISMLSEQHPDIFGVQEAFSFQLDYMTELLPEYRSAGISRLTPKDAEHPAVLYDTTTVRVLDWGNFWLSETPDRVSFGWDAACERNATWMLAEHLKSGRKFFFVNTHLDHVGKEARVKGLALVLDRIREMNSGGLPVVLTGDFNTTCDDEAIRQLEGKMKNARYAAVKSSDAMNTYNGWGSSCTAIDYIFFSGFRKCTVYETVQKEYDGIRFISDHYPVKATLIF